MNWCAGSKIAPSLQMYVVTARCGIVTGGSFATQPTTHPEEQKRDTQRAGESCSLNMACREGAKRWSYRYDDGYYYYYSVWTFHLQAIYCFGSDTG